MHNLSTIFLTNSLFAFVLAAQNDTIKALWNLEEMCECKLGYTALVYCNYGCWCGIGGGGKPVDGIDRCCMLHDKCYDAAIERKECYSVPFEYVENYTWRCVDKEPVCKDGMNRCQSALCQCDKAVVECWAHYAKPIVRVKCNRTKHRRRASFTQFRDLTSTLLFV